MLKKAIFGINNFEQTSVQLYIIWPLLKILIKQRNFPSSWAVSGRLTTPEAGTVEFFETPCFILITNQKSGLVCNDLHTKLTPAPRVLCIGWVRIFLVRLFPPTKGSEQIYVSSVILSIVKPFWVSLWAHFASFSPTLSFHL